jgi:hypothetical protein
MAIVEAHQFKGVFADPLLVEAANRPGISPEVAAALRARPPLTREVSMHFSDGVFFDIQEDESGQYIVIDRQPGGSPTRPPWPRCNVGDWVVKMDDGKFSVMTDQVYQMVADKVATLKVTEPEHKSEHKSENKTS